MSKSNVKPFDALNSGDRISDVLSSLMALWAAKYNPDEIFCDLNSIGFNIKQKKDRFLHNTHGCFYAKVIWFMRFAKKRFIFLYDLSPDYKN